MISGLEMGALCSVLVDVENCVCAWRGCGDGYVHMAGNIAPAPTGFAALSVQSEVAVCEDRDMPRAA